MGQQNVAVVLLLLLGIMVSIESRELNFDTTKVAEEGSNLVENRSAGYSNLSLRTERPDPLNKLKKYRDGFDITKKHYWSSLIFTGIYGYSIGVAWLLCGAIYIGFVMIIGSCSSGSKRKIIDGRPSCKRKWHYITMIFGFFLMLLVIVASGVAIGGSFKFHSTAISIKRIISETADEASITIYNITGAVKDIESDTDLSDAIQGSTHLSSTSQKLNEEASRIKIKAERTSRKIGKGLKILQATTAIIVLLNLVALPVFIGSILLRCRRQFHMFLTLCWLLTFFFWAFFGLYFFLDKFAGDTCMALREYKQDPHNSSLSAILPCNDHFSATSVLLDTKAGIHDLITQVNANISEFQTSSTLPKLSFVCNPFSGAPEYSYQPQNCSQDSIQIGDIPQLLKIYTCSAKCQQGEFISSTDYNKFMVYTTSLQALLNAFPGVERLASCQLVADAFSEILVGQCNPIQKYVKMTWASLVVIAICMVFLLVTWVVVARRCCDVVVRLTSQVGSVDHLKTSSVRNYQDEIGMTNS